MPVSQSKTYLNVPYSEKDAVKALGGRWDPRQKKWYVPAGKDLAAFEQWPQAELKATKPADKKLNSSLLGTVTTAKDTNFVAYDGEQPPWDE